jgi:hypothetical protein
MIFLDNIALARRWVAGADWEPGAEDRVSGYRLSIFSSAGRIADRLRAVEAAITVAGRKDRPHVSQSR